jgi:hypothetical protein
MPSSRVHATAGLSALILVTLAVPAIIPLATPRHGSTPLPPTYLPALEGPRERAPFSTDRIPDLQRLQPGYVVIGDLRPARASMTAGWAAGPASGGAAPAAGSGRPWHWRSRTRDRGGIRPRLALIFFRENLTDDVPPDDQFRWAAIRRARSRRGAHAVVARRLGLLLARTGWTAPRRPGAGRVEPAIRGR